MGFPPDGPSSFSSVGGPGAAPTPCSDVVLAADFVAIPTDGPPFFLSVDGPGIAPIPDPIVFSAEDFAAIPPAGPPFFFSVEGPEGLTWAFVFSQCHKRPFPVHRIANELTFLDLQAVVGNEGPISCRIALVGNAAIFFPQLLRELQRSQVDRSHILEPHLSEEILPLFNGS